MTRLATDGPTMSADETAVTVQKASVCPLDCPDTCSLTVTVADEHVLAVRGSRVNPITHGAVCAKVAQLYPDFVHGPNRPVIAMPLARLLAPVIVTLYSVPVDVTGALKGIHFSPRLDYVPLFEREALEAYYQARRLFDHSLRAPQFEIRFLLKTGDLVMFDNCRLLHGRSGF